MPLSVVTTVEPASEPITLAEAKAHLRVDFSDEDALILSLITAARQWLERGLNRALITRTLRATFDLPITGQASGPVGGLVGRAPRLAFDLPYASPGNTATVTSVELEADVATWSALDSTYYKLDTDNTPARLWLRTSALWLWLPGLDWQGFDTPRIRVTYTCGYGSTEASVPAAIRSALLAAVGHLYENRESGGTLPDSLLPLSYMVFSL